MKDAGSTEEGNKGTKTRYRKLVYLFFIAIFTVIVTAGSWLLLAGGREDSPIFENVIKPHHDKAEYHALRLSNKLKVVLISDPKTEKSAAALVVGAGFLNDPPDLPGLSHYVEHFLFRSTQKYPEDYQLSKFLAKNGGFVNANTWDSSTAYYFDTSAESFNESLDRFAQFFASPLFDPMCTTSILSALDSEFQRTDSDFYRTDRVIRSLTQASHPYSRFHVGNKFTLSTLPKARSINVTIETLKFFEKFYSTNLMTLAVLGKENLDQLHLMVTDHFGALKNKDTPIPEWPISPWGPDQLAIQVDIDRVFVTSRMDLIFPIPDYTQHYRSQAPDYLTSVIGDEGPGSILSLLKKTKKWATGLNAEFEVPGKGFSFFKIQVDLTDQGMQGHVHDIVHHIFQYIEMLRRIGPQKSYWETLKTIFEAKFSFKEPTEAVEVVKLLAANLQKYPAKEVWTAEYFYEDYKPELITSLLEFLRPDNLVLITVSKDNENLANLEEEPVYYAKFGHRKINKTVIERWTNCGTDDLLKFPLENEFLPTKFDLKMTPPLMQAHDIVETDNNTTTSKISPKIILDDAVSRVWFLQDGEFFVPRACVHLTILNLNSSHSVGNTNLQHLLINFVTAMMEESAYVAGEAGLSLTMSINENGIHIHVHGYDDKIGLFLNQTIGYFLNSTALLSENPDRFEVVKESYVNKCENFRYITPNSRAELTLQLLTNKQIYTKEELLDNAKNLTIQDLTTFCDQLFSEMRLQWLIYGNLVEKEAIALSRIFEENFEKIHARPMRPSHHIVSQLVRPRVRLPSGSSYLYKIEDDTDYESCVWLHFQIEPRDVRKQRLLMMFLNQMLSIHCFDVLRTQEQLGYSAGCFDSEDDNGLPSFQVYVQGMYHPKYTESRIYHFLHFITPTVNNLTTLDFDRYKAAVETEIRATKPKSMDARANFMNTEMVKGTYDFGREHEDLKILTQITRQEVKTFFNTWINPASTERKILSVHVASKFAKTVWVPNGNLQFTEKVVDVADWKNRLGYFPPSEPYVVVPPWKSS